MNDRIYVYLIIILLHTNIQALGIVVLEKNISPFKPMTDNHTSGCGLYGPQEHWWQDLQRGSLYIATHKM